LLVAVHDHKMRFVGHHCLIADRTRERLLEEQLNGVVKKPRPPERKPGLTATR
jgi:hypothetical protein